MKFADPYILWCLFALLPLTVGVVWYLRKRRRGLNAFASERLFAKIAPTVVQNRAVLKPVLLLLAFAMLIFALTGPQFGASAGKTEIKASDIVIALDVSRSMLAEDVSPNRLEKAKQAISTLFRKLKGDRVALVVFAGKAYTALPLTDDYSVGEMNLEAVSTDMVTTQGTALGAAIERARTCFPADEQDPPGRAIILITDGENHEDNPMEQAELARSEGTVIYTIGIGDPKGTPIPIHENGLTLGYKTDKSGTPVVSKLNEQILTDIAAATGGLYIQGNNTIAALDRVMKEIDSLEKKDRETKTYNPAENRYQFFVLSGILLLLAEYLISERRSLKKRVKRLFE